MVPPNSGFDFVCFHLKKNVCRVWRLRTWALRLLTASLFVLVVPLSPSSSSSFSSAACLHEDTQEVPLCFGYDFKWEVLVHDRIGSQSHAMHTFLEVLVFSCNDNRVEVPLDLECYCLKPQKVIVPFVGARWLYRNYWIFHQKVILPLKVIIS